MFGWWLVQCSLVKNQGITREKETWTPNGASMECFISAPKSRSLVWTEVSLAVHSATRRRRLTFSLQQTNPENEQWERVSGPRHALPRFPGQGLSDHHYRLFSVRPCVELQPFPILLRRELSLAAFFHKDRTLQRTIRYQHFCKPLLYFRSKGRNDMRVWWNVREGCCVVEIWGDAWSLNLCWCMRLPSKFLETLKTWVVKLMLCYCVQKKPNHKTFFKILF